MSRITKIISIVWILISVLFAIFGVKQSHGPNPESGIAPVIILTILTGPLGFLVELIIASILNLASGPQLNISFAGDIFIYAAMIAAGFFQWFIFVPALIKRFKKSKALNNP